MGGTVGTSSVVKPSPTAFVGAPMGKSSKASLIKELVALGLLKAVAAPFEGVKLLLQNQKNIIKSGRLHKPYNGILHCFATTIRNEGIFSLWRGYTAMTMGHVSATVIRFGIFQYTKILDDTQWSYTRVVVSSYVASAATQFLVNPFLYAATRMATDVKTIGSNTGDRQFNGMIDVFRKTLKSDGIVGLYRGFNITLGELVMMGTLSKAHMAELIWSGLLQNNFLSRHMVELGFWISGNMATYPLDTVSRRMMMTSGSGTVKYKSTVHAIGQIMKTEGVKTPMLESGVVICFYMAGYPLDTVSRRMMLTSRAVKYKGTLHAIAHNLTTEGEKHFNYTIPIMEKICGNGPLVNWKSQGSASSVCFEGSSSSIRASEALDAKPECHNQVIRFNIFKYAKSHEDIQWTYKQVLMLNSVALVATQLLVHPFLYAGTRMATDVKTISNMGNRQFNDGIAHGFNITLAQSGMVVIVSAGLNPWKQHYLHLSSDEILKKQ
ncbi:ADP,ATP carrier protein-like [Gossypium australe]|uniref:ADP/ATP translocase n=1 Tax=Gossypium australe TaxID=47621 RepID=A0A5B6WBG0_9ROSI|nr:ADP,ATP carrier protein-like [Gossypium australe]